MSNLVSTVFCFKYDCLNLACLAVCTGEGGGGGGGGVSGWMLSGKKTGASKSQLKILICCNIKKNIA